eukprot:362754-Chlamydomonas_euryale.AAC.20
MAANLERKRRQGDDAIPHLPSTPFHASQSLTFMLLNPQVHLPYRTPTSHAQSRLSFSPQFHPHCHNALLTS